MADLGSIFGKDSTATQFLLWGVLQQLLQPLMLPLLNELQVLIYDGVPDAPFDPATAVEGAARKVAGSIDWEGLAKQSGISGDNLAAMVQVALHSPDMSTAGELLRRKLITGGDGGPGSLTFGQVLTDLGIRPEWHDLMAQLTVSVPDQSQVLTAWLEGQIEAGEAERRLLEAGMAPDWVQTAYNASGQAPTPVEALEMLNRGIIGEGGTGPHATSYEQAFLEGPWRNKWLAAFKALRFYLPPPRTVTAMYKDGSLTHDQAAHLLTEQGLTPELVAAYLSAGQKVKASAEKHLTKTETIDLYRDRLLDKAGAHAALVALGYPAHDADELLALADVRVAASQTNAAVSRVRTLYLAGKITRAQAITTLGKLGVPAATVSDVVDIWELQHSARVKTLTPAQVVQGWYYKLLTQDDAVARLVADGYDKADATLLLAIHGKGPLAGVPVGQPGGPITAPHPAAQ